MQSSVSRSFAVLLLALAPACSDGKLPPVVELTGAAGLDAEVVELVAQHVRRVSERPADRERRARLAMVYEANELWDEARRSWEGALAAGGSDPLWSYHLAICARQSGDGDRALELLREIVAAQPEFAAARHRLGDVLLENGELTGARAEFEAAIALEPNQPNAHVGLAETLLREERFDEARLSCERALAMAPNYRRAHYNLGLAWRGLGRRDLAEEHLGLGLNAKKDFLEDPLAADVESYRRSYIVRLNEAAQYERAGKPAQAVAILEEVVKKHPDDLAVLNNLAAVYMQVERLPEAFALLERALALDPAQFATYLNLATGELARANLDAALAHAQKGIELAGTVGHAWFTRARVLYALGRTSEAYSDLNRALELDSTQWMPYAVAGDVALELELYELGIAHFQDALRLKPDHLPAHTRLAWLLDRVGRREEALSAYERASALAPGHPQIAALARELGLPPR